MRSVLAALSLCARVPFHGQQPRKQYIEMDRKLCFVGRLSPQPPPPSPPRQLFGTFQSGWVVGVVLLVVGVTVRTLLFFTWCEYIKRTHCVVMETTSRGHNTRAPITTTPTPIDDPRTQKDIYGQAASRRWSFVKRFMVVVGTIASCHVSCC